MRIRPSPIAGTWYPGDSETLKKTISEFIAQADVGALKSKPIALISPHAGYTYSGSTAGYAFKTVLGSSYDLVAVISPYHNYHQDNVLISSYEAYSTPLGNIPIDIDIVGQLNSFLESSIGRPSTPITHEKEHSLEIILPFLQVALSNQFKLLPIMLSGYNYQSAEAIGKFLAQLAQKKNIMMVASTDLSHFHMLKEANVLDSNLLDQFESMSVKNIIGAITSKKGEACGIMPVLAVLTASKLLNAKEFKILKYTTSAEITGDKSSVVGYASAVIL
jgi:AmmeMemoRadiSam system protein B